ncbi:MAG: DUF3048 domain-containing protein, partial [Clostridiales Family XIII bacterium]|nr:DUF3048 domain-containing protein [Clostridiales Family XIII bacterium]
MTVGKRNLIIGIVVAVIIATGGGIVAAILLDKETPQKKSKVKEVKKIYWPLTGEEVQLTEKDNKKVEKIISDSGISKEDAEIGVKERKISYRPISVKVENSPEARPQAGFNSADIIYETMVEGGETRFNMIFQSNFPERIGPVRSARLSDRYILPWYNGMLIYSGSNQEVSAALEEKGVTKFSSSSVYNILCERDP